MKSKLKLFAILLSIDIFVSVGRFFTVNWQKDAKQIKLPKPAHIFGLCLIKWILLGGL